jgi:hypothetical protein
MAPPLSPSVLLGQARATFERLRTPNAGLPRTENPLRDSRRPLEREPYSARPWCVSCH